MWLSGKKKERVSLFFDFDGTDGKKLEDMDLVCSSENQKSQHREANSIVRDISTV